MAKNPRRHKSRRAYGHNNSIYYQASDYGGLIFLNDYDLNDYDGSRFYKGSQSPTSDPIKKVKIFVHFFKYCTDPPHQMIFEGTKKRLHRKPNKGVYCSADRTQPNEVKRHIWARMALYVEASKKPRQSGRA